ncbi:MAG: HAMP domain-containing histidine kinase [Oscillospiraceae bacterium]|nr:HAMP domain-containing histidine kinase [Oscillospiraceae bacterium]
MSFSKKERRKRPLRSMFSSQFTVISLPVLVCLLVLAIGFGSFSYTYLVRFSRDTVSQAAEATAELTAAYADAGRLEDNWDLRMALSISANVSDNHIMICDPDGRVALCSDKEFRCRHIGMRINAQTLEESRASGEFSGIGVLEDMYEEARYITVRPVEGRNGQVDAYVIVTTGAGALMSLMQRSYTIFILTAALALVIAMVASFIFARRQTRAIGSVVRATHRFSRGDLKSRVNVESRIAEINELETTFNSMADALETTEIQRRDFVSNVSHDLKTPMSVIGGYVDGILDGTIPPERQEESLRTVSGEVKRLTNMVRSMLEISRLQAQMAEMQDARVVAMESFDITELLALALLSNEQRIESKNLDVEADFGDRAVMTLGIKERISQVVYNLIDNAIKFADPGSAIGLSVKTGGQKAYITVRNCGPDIQTEDMPKLFERFYKGDFSRNADTASSGLGLYIVKTVLDAHNENITVKSENGVTEFTFTLQLEK